MGEKPYTSSIYGLYSLIARCTCRSSNEARFRFRSRGSGTVLSLRCTSPDRTATGTPLSYVTFAYFWTHDYLVPYTKQHCIVRTHSHSDCDRRHVTHRILRPALHSHTRSARSDRSSTNHTRHHTHTHTHTRHTHTSHTRVVP